MNVLFKDLSANIGLEGQLPNETENPLLKLRKIIDAAPKEKVLKEQNSS